MNATTTQTEIMEEGITTTIGDRHEDMKTMGVAEVAAAVVAINYLVTHASYFHSMVDTRVVF